MKMLLLLGRLPLKRRLIVIIMITCALGLLLVGTFFGVYERYRIRLSLVHDLTATAQLVGDRSTAALLFDDIRTAAENLGALRAKTDIAAACIYTENGTLFAGYTADGRTASYPPVEQGNVHRFDRRSLHLFEPIMLDGKRLGTVYIQSDLVEIQGLWRQFLLMTSLLVLGAGLVTFYVSSRLQRVISEPLVAITETARLVAQKKDYSVRAVKPSADELALLVQAFNEMLDTVEAQDERLKESERKYRELVEHANSIILRWNAEGRITFINEFGLRFFGYAAAEMIGSGIMGTIVPSTASDGRDLQQLMREIVADPAAFEQNINENMLHDGRRVWIAWTNRIVRDSRGQVAEILSVGTDITERKRAEEAIRELNASLEHRVAERTAELAARNQDLERFNRLFVDRELRMKELKQRIREIEEQSPGDHEKS